MAPSGKLLPILLLAAIAVVAPYLPPAEASAAAEPPTAAAAPSPPANGVVVLHPAETEHGIPDLPVPALLPCPPLFPKIPLIPCHEAPSPPLPAAAAAVTECRPSLEKLVVPCAGFLTDGGVFAPPTECCAAFDPFYEDDAAALTCLCHLTDGGIAELLRPAPLNRRRVVPLLIACDFKIRPDTFSDVCNALKDRVPPMDLPSPPPPKHRHW